MEWRLARTTANLTDDPDWEGTVLGFAGAPAESLFFPVGGQTGAIVHGGGYVTVRIGWVNAGGSPVAIKGTCTAEPMTVDALPLPSPITPGQKQRIVSVHDPVTDIAAWRPWPMPVQPYGLWSVRLSAMTAAGATRAAVWYLAKP